MRANTMTRIYATLMTMAIGTSGLWAAQKKPDNRPEIPKVELNATGQKLLARYTEQQKSLQAELEKALPKIDEQRKSTFLKAYQDEATAIAAELNAMRAGSKSKDKEAAEKAHTAAKQALEQASQNAKAPAQAVMADLEKFLTSDKLDASLTKFIVLSQSASQALPEFAQQGPEQEALVEKMLSDSELMKQMVVADGARDGRYGEAMKIYTDIQKASSKAASGPLQRLALAVGLEHAVPIEQSNAEADKTGPATVDPVKRYLHFEKAFLAGELDPGFKDLSVWDYRWAVNGDEPDEMLAWGRKMLQNYRPDEITTSDYRWRYVKSVKTEVQYGSKDQVNDRPTLHKYQNMIMNGGVCGRRAFFGRFILRCFGMPTMARPQKGHATLVHWTPNGWVINLGAGWGWGWTTLGEDTDFLMNTQARMSGKPYLEVIRARCAAALFGESPTYGFNDEAIGFWNGVALYRQRKVVEDSKAVALAAVGTDIGEANESKEKDAVETVQLTDADRKIVVDSSGVITIPAVACSQPAASTEKIIFMKSNLGGMQLHYSRNGNPEDFEYTIDAPAAGKYALTARVVTTSAEQHLQVAVNGAKDLIDIAVPFTVGMWDKTPPVEISLVKGSNTLRFSRQVPLKGLTIRDFTLTPAK